MQLCIHLTSFLYINLRLDAIQNGAEKTTLHMPTWDDKKYGVNDPSKVEAFFQHIGDGIDIELDYGNLYATRRCL